MLSKITPLAHVQPDLFGDVSLYDYYRKARLMAVVDAINAIYGRDSLFFAVQGSARPWNVNAFTSSTSDELTTRFWEGFRLGSTFSLCLLPGSFWTIEAMGELVPQLAMTRHVIAVELQGHGHTADIERPLRYEWLADDITALIGHLGLDQADIFGSSLGGGVALQTAIRHPEVVRKLALASTAFKRDGY